MFIYFLPQAKLEKRKLTHARERSMRLLLMTCPLLRPASLRAVRGPLQLARSPGLAAVRLQLDGLDGLEATARKLLDLRLVEDAPHFVR